MIYKNNGNILFQFKKNTADEKSSVRKANGKILTLLSNCAFCGKNLKQFDLPTI